MKIIHICLTLLIASACASDLPTIQVIGELKDNPAVRITNPLPTSIYVYSYGQTDQLVATLEYKNLKADLWKKNRFEVDGDFPQTVEIKSKSHKDFKTDILPFPKAARIYRIGTTFLISKQDEEGFPARFIFTDTLQRKP